MSDYNEDRAQDHLRWMDAQSNQETLCVCGNPPPLSPRFTRTVFTQLCGQCCEALLDEQFCRLVMQGKERREIMESLELTNSGYLAIMRRMECNKTKKDEEFQMNLDTIRKIWRMMNEILIKLNAATGTVEDQQKLTERYDELALIYADADAGGELIVIPEDKNP